MLLSVRLYSPVKRDVVIPHTRVAGVLVTVDFSFILTKVNHVEKLGL